MIDSIGTTNNKCFYYYYYCSISLTIASLRSRAARQDSVRLLRRSFLVSRALQNSSARTLDDGAPLHHSLVIVFGICIGALVKTLGRGPSSVVSIANDSQILAHGIHPSWCSGAFPNHPSPAVADAAAYLSRFDKRLVLKDVTAVLYVVGSVPSCSCFCVSSCIARRCNAAKPPPVTTRVVEETSRRGAV